MKKGSPAMEIGFNEDLTTEIFLRLPVKSILRFKTVSKQWLSIVSSRRFRQIHASGIGTSTGLFYNLILECLPLGNQNFPKIFPFLDYSIKHISSSGGLLLLQCSSTPTPLQPFNLQIRPHQNYFVFNPTTKEFKRLAVPQLIRDSKLVSQTLTFDPSKSPHYKALFLCLYLPMVKMGKEYQMVIYSSETETFSWLPAITCFSFRFCGIYCNDAIHWISYYKTSFYYFDLKRECMKETPLPPKLFRFSEYFGESRGHLHLVTVESSLLEVHELKSDYSGWSVKYQVDLTCIAIASSASPEHEIYSAICSNRFTVFSVLVDEEEDLTMVFLVYGMFVAFNFKKKLCNVLRDEERFRMMYTSRYNNRDRTYGWPVAHQYIETLACV